MRILIGHDGSEGADAAIDDLRKAGLPRDVEALIVSISEVMMPSPSLAEDVVTAPMTSRRVIDALAQAKGIAEQTLNEAKDLAAKAGDRVRSYFPSWKVRTQGLAGWPATDLVSRADEWKPDLIVVGSRGRSALGRFILGSVSKKVVTDSHYSVRVARGVVEKNDSKPPRIMIGVDGSPEAEQAVREVGMRVWPRGTEVRIIAVDDGTSPKGIARSLPAPAPGAARMMVEWAERELRAIGLKVSVAIEKGDPQRVIIEEARKWDADSIFVGSRKFDGTFERFWLGSVSTALVTKAHCSVEVVRGAKTL